MEENKKPFNFKESIQSVTPFQHARIALVSNSIMLFGVLAGLITICVTSFRQYWWLAIILFGSSIQMAFQEIAAYQKYETLKKIQLIIMEDKKDGDDAEVETEQERTA